MHGVLEINISEPGHAKNCSFAITNVCCKVFGFALAGITGYRSIDCTAVLNPFAFVTVLVFTISEQYKYSDSLKDQTRQDCEERETSVICFEKYPHQELLGLAST